MPTTETLIIGGGQAGLALSHHLSAADADHVILERGRIGERWRSERWPSLRLLTPNWLSRLPGMAPPSDPDGFQAAGDFVDDLESYAASFDAPVREGVAVRRVVRVRGGYRVLAGDTVWDAQSVVVATGDSDRPQIPRLSADAPLHLHQLHTSRYRGPDELPPGAVLVVGAGSSGQQLADELHRAGRRVVLSVGSHVRMLRRYRGRDGFAWLTDLGRLHESIDDVADPRAARAARGAALTGARGGEQLDLAVLQQRGIELTGRLGSFDGETARFAGDLADSTWEADANLGRLLDTIDAHVGATSRAARIVPVDIDGAPSALDLREFSTILWATGYRRAYPWLRVPVLDAHGELIHRHGATPAPGLHALGLRFQSRRSSHIIGGVGHDAADLAARLLSSAQPLRAVA